MLGIAGLGIALLPDTLVRREIEVGLLEVILPQHGIPAGQLWLIYPTARYIAPKVRAFIEYFAAHFDPTEDPTPP